MTLSPPPLARDVSRVTQSRFTHVEHSSDFSIYTSLRMLKIWVKVLVVLSKRNFRRNEHLKIQPSLGTAPIIIKLAF